MAKPAQFTAYNLERKKPHKIASPPAKISESKLSSEWKVTKKRPAAKKATTKKKSAKAVAVEKAPRSAADVLRVTTGEETCLQCGAFSDEKSCGIACLRAFRRENFSDIIDIRGPGPMGYGAFTKPEASIKKGSYVGEYLGELRPLSAPDDSTYRFEIPDVCAVDAEPCGNWTRFINSHCRPNVKPYGHTIGRRHVIIFEALKDIDSGEEIFFNYGGRYFEKAGFLCGCDAQKNEHLPKGASTKGKGKGKAKAKK